MRIGLLLKLAFAPGLESQAYDDQHTCKYLWDTRLRFPLNSEESWSKLEVADKDRAVERALQECERLNLGWGDLTRPIIYWKLYHLHRTARMKTIRTKEGSLGVFEQDE